MGEGGTISAEGGQYPLADYVRGGQNPLADYVRGGQNPQADYVRGSDTGSNSQKISSIMYHAHTT